MAEMYGAAGGVEIARKSQREDTLSALKALQTVGEIQKIPGERALTDATARYHQAQAGKLEADTAEQAKMGQLMMGMGEGATQDTSLAAPLEEVARLGFKAGLYKKPLELAEKASTIRSHEATAANAVANKVLHQLTAQQKATEMAGARAGSVLALTSQQDYDNFRMTATARGEDVSALPESLAEARMLLQPVFNQSIKAKDQIELAMKKIRDAAEVKKDLAQAGAAGSASAASSARVRQIDQEIAFKKKYGGNTSAEVRDLYIARTEAVTQLTDNRKAAADSVAKVQIMKDRAKFKPLTTEQRADPNKRVVGQTYSTPPGVLTWGGDAQGWLPPTGAAKIKFGGKDVWVSKAPPRLKETESDAELLRAAGE